MSSGDFEFVVRRDSSIPEGRERTLKRMGKILAHFPHGVPDRANCFFYGLTLGWVLSHVIGHATQMKSMNYCHLVRPAA